MRKRFQSIKLGAAHYIPKPFDNQQLIEIVNKTLNMGSLKEEGLFGKQIIDKIENRSQSSSSPPKTEAPAVAETPKPSSPSQSGAWKGLVKPLLLTLLIIGVGIGGIFVWQLKQGRNVAFTIASSRVSGLSWGQGFLWASDWYTQTVQQYRPEKEGLVLMKSYPMSGYHLTGIALGKDGFLYTC